MKFILLEIGFKKTLLKIIVELFPLVRLLPSGGLSTTISTPPPTKFLIVKVPSIAPVSWSIASTIISEDETILFTIRSALNEFKYKFIDAEPIVSPRLNDDNKKEPPSDVKKA